MNLKNQRNIGVSTNKHLKNFLRSTLGLDYAMY